MNDRVERWERAMEWPLMVVAVVFLVAFAAPIAFPASGDLQVFSP